MNRKQGFTLIELLVVIAIIGILSSVVLASLNTARTKGSNAAAQSGLSSVQTEAALDYSTNGNYGTAAAFGTVTNGKSAGCTATGIMYVTDPQMASIITNIASNATAVYCMASTTGYTVYAQLKDNTYWCVDSNGNATSSVAVTDGYCQ